MLTIFMYKTNNTGPNMNSFGIPYFRLIGSDNIFIIWTVCFLLHTLDLIECILLQTALSIQDLGQLYHKPVRDSEGTIVISTVNYVRSPKSVSVLNSRWLPLGKLTKRAAPPTTDANVADILMASIQVLQTEFLVLYRLCKIWQETN